MDFSLNSNTINTSSETLIELIKKQDGIELQNQFDDGEKFEAAIKSQGTTISKAVSDTRKTVEESKKDSTAAYAAKQEAKVFAKGGTIEGHYITGAAVQKDNTLSINLTSKDGKSIKAQLTYGKDGSKIITLNDKKTNITTEIVYDNTGHKLQETTTKKVINPAYQNNGGSETNEVKSKGTSMMLTVVTTTTFNTINGEDVPISVAEEQNGNLTVDYFNSNGQIIRKVYSNSSGCGHTDYEYNDGKLIASRTKSVDTSNGYDVTYITNVYKTDSNGEQSLNIAYIINPDGSKITKYYDNDAKEGMQELYKVSSHTLESRNLQKIEETDKDGIVTIVTDYTKKQIKQKTLYNTSLDSQEGVISISRAKSGALSCVDCTQEAFDNFVPPEKSAPNSSFIVIANSNHGKKKSFSYDADGNLIKDASQPAPEKIVLKYDTNSDGTVNINDVTMPKFDVNGDGRIDITDATEVQRVAQRIQRYAAETKGYEEIGKNAEYDINGDGRVDVLDATQAQRAADAIQRYLVTGSVQTDKPFPSLSNAEIAQKLQDGLNNSGIKLTKDEAIKLFDINGDGKLDIADVNQLKQTVQKANDFARGLATPTAEDLKKYDIDGNGKITTYEVGILNSKAVFAEKYLNNRNTSVPMQFMAELYDTDGDNKITQTDVNYYKSLDKNFDASGILKYDTNKDGAIDVNDVKYDVKNLSMANFDINGDKSISEDDAKKLDDVALKIQKYAAETKGYEEIGKNAEYDINGDGRVDVLDATQAQRAAQAIRDYVKSESAGSSSAKIAEAEKTVNSIIESLSKTMGTDNDVDITLYDDKTYVLDTPDGIKQYQVALEPFVNSVMTYLDKNGDGIDINEFTPFGTNILKSIGYKDEEIKVYDSVNYLFNMINLNKDQNDNKIDKLELTSILAAIDSTSFHVQGNKITELFIKYNETGSLEESEIKVIEDFYNGTASDNQVFNGKTDGRFNAEDLLMSTTAEYSERTTKLSKILYDKFVNAAQNESNPDPELKATGILKYDTNKDGKIDVNDVAMPDYDINGDGEIDITDATEAQRVAQRIQRYAAETKGYEEIGKNAEYDINGDGRVDVLDATQAQRAAAAIQRYLVMGNTNNQDIKASGILKYDTNKDGAIDVNDVKYDVKNLSMANFDLNGDKSISEDDAKKLDDVALKIQKYAAETKGYEEIGKNAEYDINGDGRVDVLDATQAQRAAQAIRDYIEDTKQDCPEDEHLDDDREGAQFNDYDENLNKIRDLD